LIVTQFDLCLTPGSWLHWIGFNDNQTLVAVDDVGVCRVLICNSTPELRAGSVVSESSKFGMWTPVIKFNNTEDLFYWVVGAGEQELVCVECKAGDRFPIYLPKYTPPISSIPFQPLLVPQTTNFEEQ
jgi:hypothetical protein